jgi:hypothetical protein
MHHSRHALRYAAKKTKLGTECYATVEEATYGIQIVSWIPSTRRPAPKQYNHALSSTIMHLSSTIMHLSSTIVHILDIYAHAHVLKKAHLQISMCMHTHHGTDFFIAP